MKNGSKFEVPDRLARLLSVDNVSTVTDGRDECVYEGDRKGPSLSEALSLEQPSRSCRDANRPFL